MRMNPTAIVFILLSVVSQTRSIAGDGDAKIVHAGLVTPNTLALSIREGEVSLGQLVQYHPEPNDKLNEKPERHTTLIDQ